MPRTKHGPGATREDPPSKRGERTTTRRSSGSGERAPGANEDVPLLRDVLGLPPRLPDSTANIAMMGAAGGDEGGDEEVDFGVARPQEEGLGLSPIRATARSRTGSAPPGFACPERPECSGSCGPDGGATSASG